MRYLIFILFFATLAQADVMRKHKISSEGWGGFESTSMTYITADKMADETDTKFTKGMMKAMSGGREGASTRITRLDKELMWDVDHKKKTYSEMTFAEFREMILKARAEMAKGKAQLEKAKQQIPDSLNPEDMYSWTTEVKSEAEPKKINGWMCKNIKMIATGVHKQNPEDKTVITMDIWNSTQVAGADEMKAFYEKYLKALGFTEAQLQNGMQMMMSDYNKQFSMLMEEAKKAPGESVIMHYKVEKNKLEGPDMGGAMKDELMKSLPFGMGKKKENETPKAPSYEMKTQYSLYSELLEARSEAAPAGKFEVPEGYKLKKK